MSQRNNLSSLIQRYNFSRRVIDHRVHHDFNHAINSPPFTRAWLGATKSKLIGNIFYSFGPYVSIGALLICTAGAVADYIYRETTPDATPSALAHHFYLEPAESYLFNHKRNDSNLGEWNHNFNCWSNTKNCGRDYDWYVKPNPSA